MKLEFEIPDEVIKQVIKSRLEGQASTDYHGRIVNGPLADAIIKIADDQIQSALLGLDLSELVQKRVDHSLIPTLESIIDQQIKANAKKAVKQAMEQKA